MHAQSPGEAIFLPDPEGKGEGEDEGILLSVVLDGVAGKSYLLVLDAKEFGDWEGGDGDGGWFWVSWCAC